MTFEQAILRLREIEAAERDEGLPSQYARPPLPGEYERLEKAVIERLGSSAVVVIGLVWHVGEDGHLVCRSLFSPTDPVL